MVYAKSQVRKIRDASRIVGTAHLALREFIKPGVTTREIDDFVARHLQKNHSISPFLNYTYDDLPPFPATACLSLNDVVVHGLPDEKPLENGDVLTVDIGAKKMGYIGDSAWTYVVGDSNGQIDKIMHVGEMSLRLALGAIRPGVKVRKIAETIENFVLKNGFSIIKDYAGHGVGASLHEQPSIANYVNLDDQFLNYVLREGEVIAIEPMIAEGSGKIKQDKKAWPVRTADGKLSVHFEHTIVVTATGCDILTEQKDKS